MLAKESLSSHPSTPKPTLIVVPPTLKPSSTIILPKTSNTNPIEKRPMSTNDDCLYVRYERQSSAINSDPIRFAYIIDEHGSLHKRSRYVSINDL